MRMAVVSRQMTDSRILIVQSAKYVQQEHAVILHSFQAVLMSAAPARLAVKKMEKLLVLQINCSKDRCAEAVDAQPARVQNVFQILQLQVICVQQTDLARQDAIHKDTVKTAVQRRATAVTQDLTV